MVSVPDFNHIVSIARKDLSASIAKDAYLESVGSQVLSHRFLANSTQAVYARHVRCLDKILTNTTPAARGDMRILDWGCGKGQITYLIDQRGFNVVSCDINNPAADDSSFGQEVPIISGRQIKVVPLGHVYQLPFDEKSFDCVTSFGVLEHVESDRESLREIHRILKDGGVFYVVFLPYFMSWTQQIARLRGETYHDRLYTKRGFTQLAESCGFKVASLWHGQLFPKNSVPLSLDSALEPVDRWLCSYTPLRYFATNLEAVLVAH